MPVLYVMLYTRTVVEISAVFDMSAPHSISQSNGD